MTEIGPRPDSPAVSGRPVVGSAPFGGAGGTGLSSTIGRICDIAFDEWEAFGRQTYHADGTLLRRGGNETDDPLRERIARYWREGCGRPCHDAGTRPWSAAFVSYVLRKAGVGPGFHYAGRQAGFVRDAGLARAGALPQAPFWAYAADETELAVGDLVCTTLARGGALPLPPGGGGRDHADIVVDRLGDEVRVIGGNVGHAVSLKTLRLDGRRHLVEDQRSRIVVLKNRLG